MTPLVEAAFYADNWGVIADSVPELHDALQNLTSTLAAWRMDLSVPKSWLWGPHGSTRKDLECVQIDGQHSFLSYELVQILGATWRTLAKFRRR